MQIYTSDICVCIYLCTYDESCALNIAIGKLLLPEIVKILDEHSGHMFKFDEQSVPSISDLFMVPAGRSAQCSS